MKQTAFSFEQCHLPVQQDTCLEGDALLGYTGQL